ncbi:MAG: tryptophan 2,3-dioxygenase family protein [Myxococcota bacterium]|nr:tryptophan 2,3-dioxygenase family protein [Myxococcota bacterium]
MEVTYNSYLKIDELLGLQKPLSDGPEHDEFLFITIHQVYELWFQQVLHEMDGLVAALDESDIPKAQKTLKRILTILKTLVAQVDILETMTPLSFLSFRDRLSTSSGFQSLQFRVLEFRLGKTDPKFLHMHEEGSKGRAQLDAIVAGPSVYDKLLNHLFRSGYNIPQEVLNRDYTETYQCSEEVQDVLIQVHRHDPTNAQLCELFVDLDEGLQEWRYRHIKMVQRTIGTKKGTGGSGVDYLLTTLSQSFFEDLWAIRANF